MGVLTPLRRPLRFPYRSGARKRPNGRFRTTSRAWSKHPDPSVREPDPLGNGRDKGASDFDEGQSGRLPQKDRENTHMSKIIGIDLGTTNSCVAIMDGKTPKVIENA